MFFFLQDGSRETDDGSAVSTAVISFWISNSSHQLWPISWYQINREPWSVNFQNYQHEDGGRNSIDASIGAVFDWISHSQLQTKVTHRTWLNRELSLEISNEWASHYPTNILGNEGIRNGRLMRRDLWPVDDKSFASENGQFQWINRSSE